MAGLHLARARVLAVLDERAGLTRLSVEINATTATALCFHAFGPAPAVGDEVTVNTTAVDLGLGTGGAHLIVPSVPTHAELPGHAMKLRYTPLQVAVDAVEEGGNEPTTLDGTPVIAIALHSALIPAALGIRASDPSARIAYVMTDAAALPMALSDSVAAARSAGLLDLTVTTGQAFGGEIETVHLYSALCTAAARADVVICGMGPGNLGTGSMFGAAALEVGQIINATASLGGQPVVAPRVSFADPRERHRGVSHHTLTALSVVALAPATVVLPAMPGEGIEALTSALVPACEARGHRIVIQDVPAGTLSDPPLALHSMGRAPEDDPVHPLAPAAAGAYAASLARATSN